MATKLNLGNMNNTHNHTKLATICPFFNKFGQRQKMTGQSDFRVANGREDTFNCELHLTSRLLKCKRSVRLRNSTISYLMLRHPFTLPLHP